MKDPLQRHPFQPDHNGECLVCDNWADWPLHLETGDFTPEQLAQLREEVADGAGHDCWEWRMEGKCQLCDRDLPMCGRCYAQVPTFPANCAEDPMKLAGQPIGMYHCPDCGAMLLAGMPHFELCQQCLDRTHPGFDLVTIP